MPLKLLEAPLPSLTGNCLRWQVGFSGLVRSTFADKYFRQMSTSQAQADTLSKRNP